MSPKERRWAKDKSPFTKEEYKQPEEMNFTRNANCHHDQMSFFT